MDMPRGDGRMCAMSARLSQLRKRAGRAEAVPCAARGVLRLASGSRAMGFGRPAWCDDGAHRSGDALGPNPGFCAGVFFRPWWGLMVARSIPGAPVFEGMAGQIRPRTGPAFVVSFPVCRVVGTAFRYDSVFGLLQNGRCGPFGSFVSVLATSRYERNGYKTGG